MRPVWCIVGATVLLSVAVAGVSGQSVDEGLLEPTRQALGGKGLAGVRTLRAEGESTRVVASLRLSSAIELLLERPDRFLRIDRLRVAGTAAETTSGFVGDRFVQRTPGQRVPAPAGAAPDQRNELQRAAAAGLRSELLLLLLGFFAGTFDDSPLHVERLGIAEAPDARAEALRLTFGTGLAATLFVHVDTHLPLMVSWQGADPSAVLRLATSTDPFAATALVAAGQAAPVEHRLHFSDYRRVDALRWPFLVRHTAGGRPVEELRFERLTPNPVFKHGTFAESQ